MGKSGSGGKRPGLWKTVVGLGFAAAGISKLFALEPQRALFASWGWKAEDMRIIGAAELGGAAMLLTPGLSKLGGSLLAATSTCIALAEYRHGNDMLVTPRLGMLAASASTIFLGRA